MKFFKQSLLICIILLLQVADNINALSALTLIQQPEKTIKIGLLVPDKTTTAAIEGAELAVNVINRNAGINGTRVQLIVKSMEGPWGTGSKQAISLIFEEKVWALFGSHDGRNAHLVEQAGTKAQVVFLSAWSADPTLSQAFVPWFYNCLPNDFQQAETLVEEIYNKRKLTHVVTISDEEYDSNLACFNFLRKTELDGKKEPVNFTYENYSENITGLIDEIENEDAECIVLFCNPVISYKIFTEIKKRDMPQPLFGSLNLLNEDMLSEQELNEYNGEILIPSPAWIKSKSINFSNKYKEIYGKEPGMVAAYAFDGIHLLVEAFKNAGSPDREKIQQALTGIYIEGITGPIRFDDKGNRLGPYYIVNVKNGIPALADN
jgi:branched-chain amino acid transport system substrate-binding protein